MAVVLLHNTVSCLLSKRDLGSLHNNGSTNQLLVKRRQSVAVKRQVVAAAADIKQGNSSTKGSTVASELRRLLAEPGLLQAPACHDALSARLIERAGFPLAFMSGFCVAGTRLAVPDTGLISYGEMLDQGRNIVDAVRIPIIGDGDNGYGNAVNVRRTVRGYARAGFAGILIEDQVMPKRCGHTPGKKVVDRQEALARIRAAVDERDEGQDILIVARSDARSTDSLDEALWRVRAFADAGADIVFIDALETAEEMRALCKAAGNTPAMANMLEGGGKTPVLPPTELQDIGYKLVAYPLSLMAVSIRAMEDALGAIKSGRMSPPAALPSFEYVKEVVGFPSYYQTERRYATSSGVSDTATPVSDTVESSAPAREAPVNNGAIPVEVVTPAASIPPEDNFMADVSDRVSVEAERIRQAALAEVAYLGQSGQQSSGSQQTVRGRTLRLKISNNNTVKLDMRVPAGFMDSLVPMLPGIGGLDLRALLENAKQGRASGPDGELLLDINDKGDRVQIFLE
eukprot:jgi/Chlat1/7526/Chrsp62S07036